MEETIHEIEWERIRVSPFQPRRHFPEEELQELAESIKSIGIIHPPVVRPIKNGDTVLYYELIAGERRWRAAKLAGLHTIPVIVRNSSDDDAAAATLIENVQRVDLDPIETARAYRRLIDVFRMRQEDVALKVGKKRSTVANYLRLLMLPEEIKESLSKKKITTGHAKAILSLDDPLLQENLHQKILEKQLTVRQAERESQKIAGKPRPWNDTRDMHIEEMQERLQELLGTKVVIDHSSKRGGKIAIHYYSLDDLNRIIDLISQIQ